MNIVNNQFTKTAKELMANLDDCCGGCTCEASNGNDKARIKRTVRLTKAVPVLCESIR